MSLQTAAAKLNALNIQIRNAKHQYNKHLTSEVITPFKRCLVLTVCVAVWVCAENHTPSSARVQCSYPLPPPSPTFMTPFSH